MKFEYKNHCNIPGDMQICTNQLEILSSSTFYPLKKVESVLNDRTANYYSDDLDGSKVFTLPSSDSTDLTRDLLFYVDNVLSSGSIDFSTTDAAGNSIEFVAGDWDDVASEEGKNLFYMTEVMPGKITIFRRTLTSKATE